MLKKINLNSFRSKLILSYLLLVVLPVLMVYTISNSLFQKTMQTEINNSIFSSLNSFDTNFNNMINILASAANQIAMDRDVKTIISNWNNNEIRNGQKVMSIADYNILQSKIATITSLNTLFSAKTKIVLMDLNGMVFKNSEEITDLSITEIRNSDWFDETVKMKGYSNWVIPSEMYSSYLNSSLTLAIAIRGINDINIDGIIIISLNADDISKYMYKDSESIKSANMIISNTGIILAHPKKENIGVMYPYFSELNNEIINDNGSDTIVINGEKMILNYSTIIKTGWKSISLVDYKSIFEKTDRDRNTTIAIMFGFLMIFCVIALIIAIRFTRPINEMLIKMKLIQNGNFDVSINFNGKDEFAMLAKGFNEMAGNMKKSIKQIEYDQKKKNQLKLEALQAQINPHFLFNTLNAIKFTAMLNQDKGVVDMLCALGNILELSMNKGSEYICLTKEIKALKSYVSIQKLRYNKKFTIEYIFEENMKEFLIPKLILQPIFENCLIHGYDETHSYLKIKVVGTLKDQVVYIDISDNGKGIAPEKLERLLIVENVDLGETYSSIGLKNVHERLVLNYGMHYGLKINSSLGSGTTVTISLPALKEGSKND